MATRIEETAGSEPRIIVDCTHTFRTGAGTGIQRVVRRFADGLLQLAPAAGFSVVPVRIDRGALVPLPVEGGRVAFPTAGSARESIEAEDPRLAAWRARGHRLNRVLGSAAFAAWLDGGPNEPSLQRLLTPASRGDGIEARHGDILLSLDSSWVYDLRSALERSSGRGVTRVSVLCDVLPLTHPEYFTEGTRRWFVGWLRALLPRLDGVITISEATRQEIQRLVGAGVLGEVSMPASQAVHLGAELVVSEGTQSVRPELEQAFRQAPAFVTVGTLEPRKNVEYAIDIFDALHARAADVAWHVVGAPGWMAEHTVERLLSHAQAGRRLFWWTDLNDAELRYCYANARAAVQVSKAEGFGLPLVEARLHGAPVFASDIPVFREVLRDEGRYLPLSSATISAAILTDFLAGRLQAAGGTSSTIAATWADRTRELIECIQGLRESTLARG